MRPLKLFWGLITIESWTYRCVYSKAKIELMLDLPSIKHIKLDSSGKPVVKKNKDYDDVVAKNKELAEKLVNNPIFEQLKNGTFGKKQQVSMTDILKKGEQENGRK